MDYTIDHGLAYALGIIQLRAGERVQAEAGAMVSMSDTIEMTTAVKGGLLKGLKRSVLGGESFFINTFEASAGGGEVTVAPALPGDIVALEMTGQPLMIQSGSFLAATVDVDIDTKWGGAKTFFSREGLFLLATVPHPAIAALCPIRRPPTTRPKPPSIPNPPSARATPPPRPVRRPDPLPKPARLTPPPPPLRMHQTTRRALLRRTTQRPRKRRRRFSQPGWGARSPSPSSAPPYSLTSASS